MSTLEEMLQNYLEHCQYQKNLNGKTLKAYRIDLKQFSTFIITTDGQLNRANLNIFISYLLRVYKPKSAKRKIASLKAFFSYLEYEEILLENPFTKLKIKYQEPFLLPRTIPMEDLQRIFRTVYENMESATLTLHQQKCAIRDIAVFELLFATGLRVSELCSIKRTDLNLHQGNVRIYGKGSKERMIQITNPSVISALEHYLAIFHDQLAQSDYFFINRLGQRLSEQSVRHMINHYAKLAGVPEHITPHMFRHTFATMLLEEDVDIRYIQQILGHSSIVTTQIYTHVTSNKQKEILTMKLPRNKIVI